MKDNKETTGSANPSQAEDPSKGPDRAWVIFGKGMAILWGLVFLTMTFYAGPPSPSLLLRVWTGFLGGLFIYAACRR